MLYWLHYPGSAAAHSVTSGRLVTLLTELTQLGHHSNCEIKQARCSSDWAIPAWLPHTVWDQAGKMLYWLGYPSSATAHSIRSGRPDTLLIELSQLSHHSQCEIRQARYSTKWSILAWPPITAWVQAGQMLYWLSYPGLTTTHSVRLGRPDTLLPELSWLGCHSQC